MRHNACIPNRISGDVRGSLSASALYIIIAWFSVTHRMLQLSRAALCRSFVVAAFTLFPRSTSAYFSTSSMSTTARDGSGTITVSPKNEADQSGLVVICHGLGDTAEGFADVAEVKSIWKLL